MMFLLLTFQFFSFFLTVFSVSVLDHVSTDSDTLVLLHVLFRHGNRTPDRESQFPTDPHLNETFEPFGYSQLTIKGKQTEYEIGEYLRETYGDFIPKQYTPDVVYAISSNFKRTKMSLELVLAGLFPPLPTDIFVDGLNWQPISFNVEQDEQLIGIPLTNCANFVRQFYKYMLSSEAQSVIDNYRDLYEQLTINTGLEILTPDDVVGIYETLESEEDFGLELPEWTSEIYPEMMSEAASAYLRFATATPGLKRLTAGHLLKKILEDSLAKRDGILSEERKISLYSGHDFNVGTALRSLNLDYNRIPPYGATVFFEIHNVEGVYGLKLYYQDYEDVSPQLLTIPGCSSFCELDVLSELIGDNFPGPYDICSFSGELM